VKQIALLALVFTCGFGVCWVYRGNPESPAPPSSAVRDSLDLGGAITVRREHNQQVIVLRPVNYQVGGARVKKLGVDYTRDDELWFVEIDNLLIACVRKN
jgi:hypothetical protein